MRKQIYLLVMLPSKAKKSYLHFQEYKFVKVFFMHSHNLHLERNVCGFEVCFLFILNISYILVFIYFSLCFHSNQLKFILNS